MNYAESRQANAAARAALPVTPPPVGTYLATSWGYDQTNVEFYRVVGHTKSGKSAILQRWSAAHSDTDGGPSADYLIPGEGPAQRVIWEEIPEDERPDAWTDRRRTDRTEDFPTFVHRARWHGESTTVAGHYAKVWDGTPQYATASGWGH